VFAGCLKDTTWRTLLDIHKTQQFELKKKKTHTAQGWFNGNLQKTMAFTTPEVSGRCSPTPRMQNGQNETRLWFLGTHCISK
jgi:hypothetical protein